jgi:hypothetical protein
LSKGQNFFNITKFALADDEVDYTLWNENHPSGSNYYGYAIEQMPILEPVIDETLSMKSKLISLSRDTVRIPVVTINPTSIQINGEASNVSSQYFDLTPQTYQPAGSSGTLNGTLGYTAILHNSDYATIEVLRGTAGRAGEGNTATTPIVYGDTPNKAVFVTGLQFRVRGKPMGDSPSANWYTRITFIGNETGGLATCDVTILM